MNGRSRSAFSLVEMALALALIGFCMVALLGLLPSSLESIRDADREAEAVRWLRQIAAGIRAAAPDDGGTCRLAGFEPFSAITWRNDGRALPVADGYLSAVGAHVEESDAAFVYRVEVTPPDAADPASLGRAILRIAWPAAARWSGGEWRRSEGSEQALVLFRAR